ncbi:MAG: hypothetical protein JWO56_1987 [Acidobacteria bacterium]|nr:hypothetical protein [Acidobacteriota bacterium]
MELLAGIVVFVVALHMLRFAWEVLKILVVVVVLCALVRTCDDAGANRVGPDGRYTERSYR